jgi:hypothetical protein
MKFFQKKEKRKKKEKVSPYLFDTDLRQLKYFELSDVQSKALAQTLLRPDAS